MYQRNLWCIKAAQHCHHAQSISQFTLTPFLWNELQGTGKYGVVPCLYTRLGGLWIWWRVWVLDLEIILSFSFCSFSGTTSWCCLLSWPPLSSTENFSNGFSSLKGFHKSKSTPPLLLQFFCRESKWTDWARCEALSKHWKHQEFKGRNLNILKIHLCFLCFVFSWNLYWFMLLLRKESFFWLSLLFLK